MKSHPIIFSDSMVRAILNGEKTQTRRVAKLTDPVEYPGMPGSLCVNYRGKTWWLNSQKSHPQNISHACPYGQPGDELWVRETFGYAQVRHIETGNERIVPVYAADRESKDDRFGLIGHVWKSPIYMPHELRRIILRITDIRVERLQDISGMDAKREGVSIPAHIPHDGADLDWAKREYQLLWDSINSKRPGRSWSNNPFVWAISFERLFS